MFTIDFYDGNGFLTRQRRQSANTRRTFPAATFVQQFAHKPADSRG
jgi:hypothetical protein